MGGIEDSSGSLRWQHAEKTKQVGQEREHQCCPHNGALVANGPEYESVPASHFLQELDLKLDGLATGSISAAWRQIDSSPAAHAHAVNHLLEDLEALLAKHKCQIALAN